MEIDNIPDVVQRIIFKHLKIGAENKSKTWKMGSFYPSGVYFENERNKFDETLADKLKFCLIFPHFIENINFDLNQASMESLFVSSFIEELRHDALTIVNKRIRTNTSLLKHKVINGVWVFNHDAFGDFIEPHKPHSDWLFGLVVEYLTFLICDLSLVEFSNGLSLFELAKSFNLKRSRDLLVIKYKINV